MNYFIKLAELLASAGYSIVEYHDEYYDKEPIIIRANQGIRLRIVWVGLPEATPELPKTS